ncbi:hypothetical protein DYB31_008616, partial [Aphanomyces astaci]
MFLIGRNAESLDVPKFSNSTECNLTTPRAMSILSHIASHQHAHFAKQAAQVIGLLVLTKLGLTLLSGIYAFFLRGGKKLTKYGKWAIVTGATDGIGKATALELARKGLNIVLISRTQSKLDEVAKEITTKYNTVSVKTLSVDYSNLTDESVAAIRKVIADVGDYFHELSDESVASLVNMNIKSTFVMSKLVLPGMVERKRGAIVNCSSGSARIACPLCIEQYTLGLAGEYAAKNISVQCHTPMFVTSKLSKIRHASFAVPSPTTYAKAAVANIGYETVVSPYWPHALQIWLYEAVPHFIMSKVALSTHLGIRKPSALKRKDHPSPSSPRSANSVTFADLKAAQRRSMKALREIALTEINSLEPQMPEASRREIAAVLQAHVNEMSSSTFTHLSRVYFPTELRTPPCRPSHPSNLIICIESTKKTESPVDPAALARIKDLEAQIHATEQRIHAHQSRLPTTIRDILHANFAAQAKALEVALSSPSKVPVTDSDGTSIKYSEEDIAAVKATFARVRRLSIAHPDDLPISH